MSRRKSKAEPRPSHETREAIVEGSIVDRRYLVRRLIATGGMGVVLEVELMPKLEIGWFRVVRGNYGLPKLKTMADFVDQLAMIEPEARAGGFRF